MGEREVREGPAVIVLHYNEQLEDSVKQVHILNKNQAIRLKALKDFDDKKAGTVWQVRGKLIV